MKETGSPLIHNGFAIILFWLGTSKVAIYFDFADDQIISMQDKEDTHYLLRKLKKKYHMGIVNKAK